MSKFFVDSPPNEAPIDEVYLWLSVDDTGEGLVVFMDGSLRGAPLMASKKRLLKDMRPFATDVAKLSGKKLRLVRFSRAQIVEEIDASPDARWHIWLKNDPMCQSPQAPSPYTHFWEFSHEVVGTKRENDPHWCPACKRLAYERIASNAAKRMAKGK